MHGGISKKKSCGMFTYDNWNFKPQISSIFHFDQGHDGQMAHVLGVKENYLCKSSARPLRPLKLHQQQLDEEHVQ